MTTLFTRGGVLLAVLPLLAALAGCSGSAGDDAAAGSVAAAFTEAVSSGDADSACELLAESTRSSLEEESGGPCGQALATLDLPTSGPVQSTQAYGRGAQSVVASDVLFLTLEPAGWRVSAAGCTLVPDKPYRCDAKGD